MPTARRGRTYYKQGANDSRGVNGFCSVLFIIMLLIVPPIILLGSERSRYTRYVALSDALNSDTVELNDHHINYKTLQSLPPNTLLHGISTNIDTLTSDSKMSVSIPGALTLKRNAEYCQWQEVKSQRCETCTRTVEAKDGSSKEETYQCNCVLEYNYIKSWRSHRINSMLFDQPGAHHNPQRDPMPSALYVGDNVKLQFHKGEGDDDTENQQHTTQQHHNKKKKGKSIEAKLDPNMLSSGVRKQPYRRIEFTPNGHTPTPSFFSRLFSFFGPTRQTRYEPLQLLKDTPYSPAATNDNFVYVGQGGYFFSPYKSDTASKLFNYFTQYLEGSLFDWQIGDLMPSCTAGDVRFYYEVQDPTVVSVLGQLGSGSHGSELKITPRTLTGVGDEKAATIGLVHAGRHSSQDMLLAEDSDSKNKAHLVRALLFLWSIPTSRLLGVAFERELGESSFLVQTEGVLGLFFAMMGAIWLVIWGETYGAKETTLLFFIGGTLGCLAAKSAVRKGTGRAWHSVYCRILKWANAPPDWRVEDSYEAVPMKGGNIGSSKMS